MNYDHSCNDSKLVFFRGLVLFMTRQKEKNNVVTSRD